MRLLITLYNFPKAASIFDKDVCLKCLSKCTYTTNQKFTKYLDVKEFEVRNVKYCGSHLRHYYCLPNT